MSKNSKNGLLWMRNALYEIYNKAHESDWEDFSKWMQRKFSAGRKLKYTKAELLDLLFWLRANLKKSAQGTDEHFAIAGLIPIDDAPFSKSDTASDSMDAEGQREVTALQVESENRAMEYICRVDLWSIDVTRLAEAFEWFGRLLQSHKANRVKKYKISKGQRIGISKKIKEWENRKSR